jgi:hypothetical protein
VLADPLPAEVQDLLATGVVTTDSYSEGCYESYKESANENTTSTIVSPPTMAPKDASTEAPTSAAGYVSYSVAWLMMLLVVPS